MMALVFGTRIELLTMLHIFNNNGAQIARSPGHLKAMLANLLPLAIRLLMRHYVRINASPDSAGPTFLAGARCTGGNLDCGHPGPEFSLHFI